MRSVAEEGSAEDADAQHGGDRHIEEEPVDTGTVITMPFEVSRGEETTGEGEDQDGDLKEEIQIESVHTESHDSEH